MVASARKGDRTRLALISGLLLVACDLPPTRRALTVWAEPAAGLEETTWVLTSASCASGRTFTRDQFAMSLRARQPVSGPLVLSVQSQLFTCRENLTLALHPSPAASLFVLEEQTRVQVEGDCTVRKQPPAVVSFVHERRVVTLRGALVPLCGGLEAELVFVPGQT